MTTSSNFDFALAMDRLPVRLVTFSGESLEGEVFLHSGSDLHPGPESLRERLNDTHYQFLPCKIGERVELVHLRWIAYVETPGSLPELVADEEAGAGHRAATVRLTSGEVLEGDVVYLRPDGSRRLSDLLNAGEERFFIMTAPGATRCVNREAVLRAHD